VLKFYFENPTSTPKRSGTVGRSNIFPPNEKSSPENSASQTLENFNQVFAAFGFQRSGGTET